MNEQEVKKILKNELKFSENDICNLEIFIKLLLEYNSRYNLISKSTEKIIWSRHILDSAQLLKHINVNLGSTLADFGTGAGFPGIILAIFNKNTKFHVKLFEKSSVKRDFLNTVIKKIKLDAEVLENVYDMESDVDIVVSRAFKKLEQIVKISREILKKPHKIVILKGKNAQTEINNVSLPTNYSYKLEKSITSDDSKIIIIEVK
jgi:16S rRNA (guanine527-N7)-methyltransferase